MFAETVLRNVGREVVSPEREQSTALMKQIFEALSEGVIKFSWNRPESNTDLFSYEFRSCQKEEDELS